MVTFNSLRVKILLFNFISFIIIFIIISNCQKAPKPVEGEMEIGRINELISVLKGRVNCLTLSKNNQVLVVSPEMGGRIIGISADGIEGKNLLWINEEITSEDFFKADVPFINPGGHRSWIAPEDAFYIDDDDNWFCPKVMDPGIYTVISSTNKSVTVSNKFTIKDKSKNEYNLQLKRDISITDSPPVPASELPEEIKFVGYTVIHSLKNLSQKTIGKDIPFVGLWSLVQVSPSGTVIIPINPAPEGKKAYQGYFEPILPERINIADNIISIKIDGKRREKIGISPESSKGCIAYLSVENNDEGVLFIKKFSVEPEGTYLDGPWNVKRENGDAVQIYNDDGNMGGFAEIECHGPAKVIKPQEEESHSIDIYVFTGPLDNLKIIGSKIMGIDFNKIQYF